MERFVCIHGHFYQPPRENPWLEVVELQDSAHPYHDWNDRISLECYAPNAVARIMDEKGRILQLANNYAWISFNFGPTLLAWMEEQRPDIYRLILEADKESQDRFSGHGSAMAQVYNHVILPLASRADKVTQVRWGIRDFERRFGRRPEGMWLAETAVDVESLEVLAEEGIRFTVLAPHQAARFRKQGERDWHDVAHGKIDPRRAYVQKLPSGRFINLFFYDGPIARGVAFEGLLRKGETFAERLVSGFTDQPGPQLVHIATDGESYGHHSEHGDMALAYALHTIAEKKLARITNYAEFLELQPPQHEVEIVENTSWSCAHGVERWRSDCGCSMGRVGWNQQWRGPLRDALDWLRAHLAPRFQELAGAYLKDPWAARDAYVEVILDRSPESVRRFFDQHARRSLTPQEEITTRKLLELQRNALLMYTSCGWFFEEVSGLEAAQVLAFAGRVIQLAEEVFGETLEPDFLVKLEKAPSNLRFFRNARGVYEKNVRPMRVGWERITAHYAISSLFEPYGDQTRFYCYQADRRDQQTWEAGKTRLVLGRAVITSVITGESQDYTYGVIHFGDHNVYAGVRTYSGQAVYQEMRTEFEKAFERVDVPILIRLIDRYFGEPHFSLESLFRDEQRRVLKRVLKANLSDVVDTFNRVYEQQQPIMRFLRHLRVPLPRPYQLTADLLFTSDLRWAFGEDDPVPDRIRALVDEALQWGIELPRRDLGYKFSKALGRAAERWRDAPDQLDLLRNVSQIILLAGDLPFEVNFWKPQNIWFEVGRTALPAMEQQAQAGSPTARDWLTEYLAVGEALGIAVDELKKKVDQILASPTLDQLALTVWNEFPRPVATYRVQMTATFPFADAAAVVPYLHELGITDFYASPILQARAGSTHGYDVCDHSRFNQELGGQEGFNRLHEALATHQMGLILDIVPNHMGVGDPSNRWWLDVLENGPASRYAQFFDIDWHSINPDLESKVLLPILGGLYGAELENGTLKLSYEEGRFWLTYWSHRLPVAPRSTAPILEFCHQDLARKVGEDQEDVEELHSIVVALDHLPPREELPPEVMAARYREKLAIQRRLTRLVEANPEARVSLDRALVVFNGTPGEPRSFDRLDVLIANQPYRPAYWRTAAEEINYRRFFDINELAAIRMELPEVFEETHALILGLIHQGKASGLRIDHPDGLRDPAAYFRSLQRACFLGRLRARLQTPLPDNLLSAQFERLWTQAREPTEKTNLHRWGCYVIAEKILTEEEPLPLDWAVAGTVGYDFLVAVNGLFVARENEEIFDRLYQDWTGDRRAFHDLVYVAKKRIMVLSMASEINSLAHRLDRLTERNRHYRDFTLNALRQALREVIAALPVYRTYVTGPGQVAERDRHFIEFAVREAKERNPGLAEEVFDFLGHLLVLRNLGGFSEPDREAVLEWVLRFQQMTGPIMAKGVEDTAFYMYHRLITVNEVGGHPDHFGLSPSAFHSQNMERAQRWPAALLSTSTHDTKRSEDVRARLNALSELPEEWEQALARWRPWNAPHLTDLAGKTAPSPGDQYLLYQTLLGAWPVAKSSPRGSHPAGLEINPGHSFPPDYASFRQRIAEYMQKAAKEAKVHTSWINPNKDYDQAMRSFIEAILPEKGDNPFVTDLDAFARRLAHFGFINALAQTTLKLTCPGVPDIYQGCELWDFSLVDPDNRRPVDYARRRSVLAELRQKIDAAGEDLIPLARQLLDCTTEGKVKLFVIHRLLTLRRRHPDLFLNGQYEPLETLNAEAGTLMAFTRLREQHALTVAVPIRIVRLLEGREELPVGNVWGEGRLLFPRQVGRGRWRNLFTGERLEVPETVGPSSLPLKEIFRTFPVAALLREDS